VRVMGRCRWWLLVVSAGLLALVLGGCGPGHGGDRPLGVARLDLAASVVRVDVPLSGRSDALVVAAGEEILVIGGEAAATSPEEYGRFDGVADGARLELRTGRWRPVAPIPAGPLYHPVGVWTGEELVVVGSPCGPGSGWAEDDDAVICRPGGMWVGAYSPKQDRWRTIERRPAESEGARADEEEAWDAVAVGWTGRWAVFGAGAAGELLLVDPGAGTVRWVPMPAAREGANTAIQGPCAVDGALLAVDGISNSNPALPVTLQAPLRVLRLAGDGGGWEEIDATPRPVTDRLDAEVIDCGVPGSAPVYLPILKLPGLPLGEGVLWWDPRPGRWERLPPVPTDPRILTPRVQTAVEVEGHKVLMLHGVQLLDSPLPPASDPAEERRRISEWRPHVHSVQEWFVWGSGAGGWRRVPVSSPLPAGTGSAGMAGGWLVPEDVTWVEPGPGEERPMAQLTLVNVRVLVASDTTTSAPTTTPAPTG